MNCQFDSLDGTTFLMTRSHDSHVSKKEGILLIIS